MIKEAIAKGETVEIAFANACREPVSYTHLTLPTNSLV